MAYRIAPPASTRSGPKRSAIAPTNGWPAPHSSIWIASASANTSRPQPWAEDIGVRNRPSADRGPNPIAPIRQPQARITTGVRQVGETRALDCINIDGQACAGAARCTGLSTIGRLISAEATPKNTDSHHTTSYEPVRSNRNPPSQTPRNPPTWWLKNAKPNSIASHLVPNISATRPEVGGIVDSHRSPVTAPKTIAAAGLAGNVINATTASARPK